MVDKCFETTLVDKSFDVDKSRQGLWDIHMQTWTLRHIGRQGFETNTCIHEFWDRLIDKSFKIDTSNKSFEELQNDSIDKKLWQTN